MVWTDADMATADYDHSGSVTFGVRPHTDTQDAEFKCMRPQSQAGPGLPNETLIFDDRAHLESRSSLSSST